MISKQRLGWIAFQTHRVSCLKPIKLALRFGKHMVVLILSLLGCTPTCEQVCEKLTTCDELDSISSEIDCQSACTAQELLYEDWEDEEKRNAFDELKVCIGENTCDEIADGLCYNEVIYMF